MLEFDVTCKQTFTFSSHFLLLIILFLIVGSGDVSIWDFSGYEPYFMLYDHFIGDPNAIHVITFSLAEPHATQLAQVLFWMNFLKARIPPFEPIGTIRLLQ